MGHSRIDKPLNFDDTMEDQYLEQPSFNSNSSFSSFTNPLTSTPINARKPKNNCEAIAESLSPSFSLINDSSSSDSSDQMQDLGQDPHSVD